MNCGKAKKFTSESNSCILHTFVGASEVRLRCLKWLKEMNTPGRVQEVRHDVLQLAFVRHESDLCYLKIWKCQYADCWTDRGVVFFNAWKRMGLDWSMDYSKAGCVLNRRIQFRSTTT